MRATGITCAAPTTGATGELFCRYSTVFSILTREPAESIAFIHDRMPVILAPDIKTDWLNPKYNASEILASAVLDVQYFSVA